MTFLPNPPERCDLSGCTVLALPAEIDFCNARELLPLVLSTADARDEELRLLVLDLTATHFMDSQGVGLISQVHHHLGGSARLRVVAAPQSVPSRVLELSGLRRDVPVYDNLTEALWS
ncbi:STAS domain-containing protein [Streptomyces sp. NPDC005876]|jgi:anti-anti-sigma factor|uniref:STAS domain-containing protein n=1 Tax=unclassified Streptomyces TaxID=2593676 RepID=UPI00340E710D